MREKTRPDVLRLIRPCRPDHAVLTDPTDEEERALRKIGFSRADEDAYRVHRKTWPVEMGDE